MGLTLSVDRRPRWRPAGPTRSWPPCAKQQLAAEYTNFTQPTDICIGLDQLVWPSLRLRSKDGVQAPGDGRGADHGVEIITALPQALARVMDQEHMRAGLSGEPVEGQQRGGHPP